MYLERRWASSSLNSKGYCWRLYFNSPIVMYSSSHYSVFSYAGEGFLPVDDYRRNWAFSGLLAEVLFLSKYDLTSSKLKRNPRKRYLRCSPRCSISLGSTFLFFSANSLCLSSEVCCTRIFWTYYVCFRVSWAPNSMLLLRKSFPFCENYEALLICFYPTPFFPLMLVFDSSSCSLASLLRV